MENPGFTQLVTVSSCVCWLWVYCQLFSVPSIAFVQQAWIYQTHSLTDLNLNPSISLDWFLLDKHIIALAPVRPMQQYQPLCALPSTTRRCRLQCRCRGCRQRYSWCWGGHRGWKTTSNLMLPRVREKLAWMRLVEDALIDTSDETGDKVHMKFGN